MTYGEQRCNDHLQVYLGRERKNFFDLAQILGPRPEACSPLWVSPPTGDAVYSSPAVADGVVYAGSLDHKLYAFHLHGTIP
jgi:outer membrane protein assembly factor BamB